MSVVTDALARDVDAAARAVPGVVEVYAARRVRAVLGGRDDAPLSVVDDRRGETAVIVSVGLSGAARTGETAARVAAAVRALFAGPVEVTVRVSRVVPGL